MDAARASMAMQADMLGFGADLAVAPRWLSDVIEDFDKASPACPHLPPLFGRFVAPIWFYPFTMTLRCGLCPVLPAPFCQLCGGAASPHAALEGLLMVTFSLCGDHELTTI